MSTSSRPFLFCGGGDQWERGTKERGPLLPLGGGHVVQWGEFRSREMGWWNFFSWEFPARILYLGEQVLGISVRGGGGCRAKGYRCKVVPTIKRDYAKHFGLLHLKTFYILLFSYLYIFFLNSIVLSWCWE